MSLQEHEICLLSICFDIFVANNVLKIISSRKNIDLFSSVFMKSIPNNFTPTFQEVGWVAQPLIFCRRHKNFSWSHGIELIITKLIGFYSQCVITLLFATVFN